MVGSPSHTLQPVVVLPKEQQRRRFGLLLNAALDRRGVPQDSRQESRTTWLFEELKEGGVPLVSREAVRKWLRGIDFPDQSNEAILRQRLDIEAWELDTSRDDDAPDLPRHAAGMVLAEPSGDYIGIRRGTLRLSAGVIGYAIEFENNDAEPIFFRRAWFMARRLDPEKLLALKVRGPSMEPLLFDSDTVVINLSDTTPRDGEVFAINYEGECVIKRMLRDVGEWWLASDNSDKRRFPHKKCGEDVQILGRIVHRSSEKL